MKEFMKEIITKYENAEWHMLQTSVDENSDKSELFKGVSILNNTPLDYTTVLKCLALKSTGADVTVTISDNMSRVEGAIDFLKKNNLNYVPVNELKGKEFDIVLDCNGSMQGIVTAKKGIVELTGSGKYKYDNVNVPVVNVDDSETKKLETYFGTADGFVRGFLQETGLSSSDMENKIFIIYGFGKVGQGIAYGLSLLNAKVIVVDINEAILELSKKYKNVIKSIKGDNIKEIKDAFKSCFCVVTTTGITGFISKYFDREAIPRSTYLANMGAEDEFGYKFEDNEVLYSKNSLNFALKRPTLAKFLDPIFYAHNKAAEIILDKKYHNNLQSGLNPLPKDIDNIILNKWESYYSKIKTS